jgi:hypothetical protein
MLPGEYWQSHEAGIHMNAKGLQVHCRLWADRVEAWLDEFLPPSR